MSEEEHWKPDEVRFVLQTEAWQLSLGDNEIRIYSMMSNNYREIRLFSNGVGSFVGWLKEEEIEALKANANTNANNKPDSKTG